MIIVILLMVIFIAIGILFLNNKCSWLISGYNTMSKKEKYDEKALYKFMAYFIFAISACLDLMGIVVFGGVIYCNTGKRFFK